MPKNNGDVLLVHSSDLHIDHGYGPNAYGGNPIMGLMSVLDAAERLNADAVLVAGDMFEHNRQPQHVLDDTAAILANAAMHVVILPGNHDPLIPESAFHRGGIADIDKVHILGMTHEEAIHLEELELEIWGHAHLDYGDMAPLRAPRQRTTKWQVAMAHGHFEAAPDPMRKHNPGWMINSAEITATGADYVALGHWNQPKRVGDNGIHAYYSGSPDLAETVNLVRLGAGGIEVTREAVRFEFEP
ncbi:MAG: metallophosphoesterase [Rhodospirillales bacterium]|nr:metallophosphoesterase [Rhodospirillales bacterium]